MGGHIDKRHGIHLIGSRVIAVVAQGSKVDIQISKQNGEAALWACPPRFIDVC
jgi:hypothetical protein